MYRVILTNILCALIISSCCAPIPWSAWRYEQVIKFEEHPSPWNLPDKNDFPDLYVDGAFVQVFLRAHDETTNKGSSPYRLNANVITNNSQHKGVTIHSITVSDSNHKVYVIQPISVNKAAKKTANLSFPLTNTFNSLNYHNPKPKMNKFKIATVRTDSTLDLKPELGYKITVIIDLEVRREVSSVRKKVIYRFLPYEDGGIWQCISA